ncbi:MAG: phosphoserine phosphatase SerB [Paludibacteraceae bacterium]|jgi:phosphoserine phosphatase|nr:phosphoserine phosphatase SerB [Paludibacteraceae bacterium]MBP7219861.1 phosphoserine phosphatase SerB [Paludibacteraceae bacterium]MBP8628200.1 phosphoserine phosphatase SerB [Paludibacteraceae bacterium]MBP8781494.1 phosphoserine phosphatase SerB [Paludibacteraceae bacterium]MBP9647652.1 phosphoserine phosphatase SerB [Paludibacteraceae bacterium]
MGNSEIILINISGDDQPGVTSAVAGILGKYNATILDIGQADIHHTLSLGILFKTSNSFDAANILKEVLFKCSELNLNVRFTPISIPQYNEWVNRQGSGRYIVTLLGKLITAEQLSIVTKAISEQELNIDSIKRLTGRPSLENLNDNVRSCIELSVRGDLKNKDQLSSQFMSYASELGIDISFQKDDMYRRNRRLICFDMDSTLIQTEVIDELAEKAGVGKKVRAITEAAMRGEIDFNESFIKRVALLKGLDESVMEEIAQNLPIMDGAKRLMTILKKYGFKIAILSGGFTYFGNALKKQFDVDYVYANELEIVNGKLTGKHLGEIVDGKRKAELLRLIAQFEKIELEQVIAVGDGANDLPMLNLAGLGIAFHAKPKVKENAQQAISTIGLDGILYFLGFRDIHMNE